jgi:hypothetical protein
MFAHKESSLKYLDPYLVDINVDVNPNVAYIYLWDGTHQEYKYVINKFNLPRAI